MPTVEKEAFFYNALNVATEAAYHRLVKFKTACGSWEEAWRKTKSGFPGVQLEAEWSKLEKRGLKLVLLENPVYPALLKEIPSPPLGLYFRGNLPPKDTPAVAIVGTRRATPEGKETAAEFAQALARFGTVIVSGLAFGIDAAAHKGALRGGGKTWAVLGNSADEVYPASNQKLGEEILRAGGILSEYPAGTPPLPYHFLARNRILSGLCRATLVVEAPENSGALVTARFALDQNRDVFVLPGPARHPNFRGSHTLIRAGAELVTSPEEVLEALGLRQAAQVPAQEDADLTPAEKQILGLLRQSSAPLHIDKIVELTNLDTQTVNQAVTFLIIKGAAKENGAGYMLNQK